MANKTNYADGKSVASLCFLPPVICGERRRVKRNMVQEVKNRVQKLMEDFVFLDCRLGSHPKVHASVFWDMPLRPGIGPQLRPLASTRETMRFREVFDASDRMRSIIAQSFDKRAYIVTSHAQEWKDVHSSLTVPIAEHGVLSIDSPVPNYFHEKNLGLAQLLAALIAYTKLHLELQIHQATPISLSLGNALRQVREELGLTQSELAEKIGKSRIALSRWENGAQPPTWGPLYKWCSGLCLFSAGKGTLLKVVDITPKLIKFLKEDPDRLRGLSPSQFERFVAERLDRMGYDVTLPTATSFKDGGIDLIAVPRIRNIGSFILAGQVKHHRTGRKTGRGAVDRLLSWKDSAFRLGLLVTNTEFTKDALWVAAREHNKFFLRLRDFEDLKRWLQDKFWSPEEWRELPVKIELAPGVAVSIPKSNLKKSLSIWPIDRFDAEQTQS